VAKKRKLTTEEDHLWRMAMKDTEPFKGSGGGQPGPHAPVQAKRRAGVKPHQPTAPKKLGSPTPPILHHAPLPFQKPGNQPDLSNLDRKSQQRVRRGKIEIDGKIDLHGMRQGEAHQRLIERISRARRDGKRVLLVVTGKGSSKGGSRDGPQTGIEPFWARGGGVLKNQVPNWLGQEPLRSMIFSVQQAHQLHGGGGALYVFLKRAG
jgi:DNA-nicking Smr family endonuclease